MSHSEEELLRSFQCAEYFSNPVYRRGVFDVTCHLDVVLPESKLHVREAIELLVVGYPGTDGIEFGYRRSCPGIWAYYPSEQRFSLVASSLHELVVGWSNGTISV